MKIKASTLVSTPTRRHVLATGAAAFAGIQVVPRREWVDACKAKNPKLALAGFDYSAPFTEALLVGLLAIRFGKRVEWDSANLRSPNTPEADRFIHKDYRAGFEA